MTPDGIGLEIEKPVLGLPELYPMYSFLLFLLLPFFCTKLSLGHNLLLHLVDLPENRQP